MPHSVVGVLKSTVGSLSSPAGEAVWAEGGVPILTENVAQAYHRLTHCRRRGRGRAFSRLRQRVKRSRCNHLGASSAAEVPISDVSSRASTIHQHLPLRLRSLKFFSRKPPGWKRCVSGLPRSRAAATGRGENDLPGVLPLRGSLSRDRMIVI